MHMKKLLFFAVTAAIAVSCAKTGEVIPVQGPSIGFDTWTSNLTKADGTSKHMEFPDGATFDVFGYKQAGETKTTVFDGETVTFDGTAWNYGTIRFWDRTTDKYVFYAISPAGIVVNNPTPAQTGLFVTNDLTFSGKDQDVLIAKKKEVLKASYGLEVGLEFQPVAALFDLKVKKAKNLKEADLTINSITINNIQTKGHVSVSEYEGDDTPKITWTPNTSAPTSHFNNTHGITPVTVPFTIKKGIEHGTANSQFLINNLVVMPQTLADGQQQMVINYTINFSGVTISRERTIDLNQFDLTDMEADKGRAESDQNTAPFVTSWESGKHYTYYLTINADIIVFNATISDWTDVNTFHYIVD